MTSPAKDHVINGHFPAGGPIDFRPKQHYLLYARTGVLRLEDDGQRWSLPPARAALIKAERPITFWLPQAVTALSVLFVPKGPPPATPLSVFDISALGRALLEELRHCTQGPQNAHETLLFEALRSTIWNSAQHPSPAHRPIGKSDLVRRALDQTERNLASGLSFADLALTLATTERTLARHILAETGMTWRANLRRIRIIRAMESLAATRENITDIALSTGYTSLSAFNAAFRDLTGQSPSDYRDSVNPMI